MRKYLLVAALIVVGCGGTQKPTVTPTAGTAPVGTAPAGTVSATTVKASAAIVLKADGQQDTAPFHLESGRYKSTWEAFDDCEYFGDLKPGNFTYALRAASPTSGVTYLNGVKDGEYYVRMNTGPAPKCRWQITLERA